MDRQRRRAAIASFNQKQREAFDRGGDVAVLNRERLRFIDNLMREIWESVAWPHDWHQQICLVAVGGYGRGELAPHSDIDLLLLHSAEHPLSAECEACSVRFVTALFDLSLEVGHAVRSIEDTVEQARADITIMTSIMEARTVVGDDRFRLRMRAATGPDELWSAADYHRGKMAEQAARHRRFNHIDYNLEPNVKGGPGGLRDLHTLRWVAHRHFGTSDIGHLVTLGFVTADEFDLINKAQRFLTRVRYGLHLSADRREDRLVFEYQRKLAALFGYADRHDKLAVEQFMHDYYRHVLELQFLSDVLLQHFDEAVLRAHQQEPVEVINERFQIHGGYIEARHAQVFRQTPSALLEIFVLTANRSDISGVRASTIRQIRQDAFQIDESFRHDPQNTHYFMRLLRAPHELVTQLTRMRRYGVLGRYLPEFGRVIGQMQHDLFHIYTVDAHTLQVIRNMRRFVSRASEKEFPVLCNVVLELPKIELLYIAGLYHDIGKGRGGDHSDLGAVDVERFCDRHSVAGDDKALVAWLVKDHLVMSATAQRQDLSDPDVIEAFALRVKTQNRLNYLYALTVADITATNPTLWNSWRATLLRQLYLETSAFLQAGTRPSSRDERINQRLDESLKGLAERGIDEPTARRIWSEPDQDYFLDHGAADIVWHTQAIARHDLTNGPLVLVRNLGIDEEGATEIFLYTRDQPNLFAASVAVLDQLNLSIQDARIYTSRGDLCFNSYMVLGADGRPLGQFESQHRHIRDRLVAELKDPNAFPSIVSRRVPRQLRQFAIPTKVDISQEIDDAGEPYTLLRLEAADRPGLLARIGTIFMEFNVNVQGARITTLGERVEDWFYIGERPRASGEPLGKPFSDPHRIAALSERICQRLDEELR